MMTDSSGSKSVHTLRHFGRRIASFTPYLGIVPPPALRPMGISAMTMAKNEEDWVASSLNSILNSVDEILVADHGSEDSTPRILARLAHEHPERIRLINVGDRDFPSAINLMMSQTRYRWILRWHADFIARTSGPSSISHLVRLGAPIPRSPRSTGTISVYVLIQVGVRSQGTMGVSARPLVL